MDNKGNGASLYFVDPEKLSPHPLASQYFPQGSEEEIEELKRTIKAVGILHPIVAKPSGEILSGRDRWTGAKELGLKTVPVRFLNFKRVEDEELAILAANLCVRSHSPVIIKRAGERMEELISGNGNGRGPLIIEDNSLPQGLSPADRGRLKQELKRALADAEKKGREAGQREKEDEFKKTISRLTQQNKNLESSLGEVIEARDKYAEELAQEKQKTKEETAKLARQINALRDEKEKQLKEAKKEQEGLKNRVAKLTERLGKSAKELEEEATGLGAKEKRLMALAIQISRIGPEVLIPCIVDLSAEKDRKKEIAGALQKLASWSREMEEALK